MTFEQAVTQAIESQRELLNQVKQLEREVETLRHNINVFVTDILGETQRLLKAKVNSGGAADIATMAEESVAAALNPLRARNRSAHD